MLYSHPGSWLQDRFIIPLMDFGVEKTGLTGWPDVSNKFISDKSTAMFPRFVLLCL